MDKEKKDRTGWCGWCGHNPTAPINEAARDKTSKCYGCWFTDNKKNWIAIKKAPTDARA